MANNLERNLIDANGKYINFDQHREEYTQHYDALRKEIYTQLRSNKVLDKILKGHTLGGTWLSTATTLQVFGINFLQPDP